MVHREDALVPKCPVHKGATVEVKKNTKSVISRQGKALVKRGESSCLCASQREKNKINLKKYEKISLCITTVTFKNEVKNSETIVINKLSENMKSQRMSRNRNCVTIAFVVCTYHTTFPGNNVPAGLLFIYHFSVNITAILKVTA